MSNTVVTFSEEVEAQIAALLGPAQRIIAEAESALVGTPWYRVEAFLLGLHDVLLKETAEKFPDLQDDERDWLAMTATARIAFRFGAAFRKGGEHSE